MLTWQKQKRTYTVREEDNMRKSISSRISVIYKVLFGKKK